MRDGNFFFVGRVGGIFFNLNGVLPGNETMIFFIFFYFLGRGLGSIFLFFCNIQCKFY